MKRQRETSKSLPSIPEPEPVVVIRPDPEPPDLNQGDDSGGTFERVSDIHWECRHHLQMADPTTDALEAEYDKLLSATQRSIPYHRQRQLTGFAGSLELVFGPRRQGRRHGGLVGDFVRRVVGVGAHRVWKRVDAAQP